MPWALIKRIFSPPQSMVIALSKRILKLKVVRYFFAAITATVVDVTVYFLAYNYIIQKRDLPLGFITITAPTIALGISFCFGISTNFTLTKLFVFKESDLRTRYQFIRYVVVALSMLFLNYVLMSILIRQFGWYPTPSRAFAAISIGVLSFTLHKIYSFRVSNDEEVTED
jgi:putative flippase GtrA